MPESSFSGYGCVLVCGSRRFDDFAGVQAVIYQRLAVLPKTAVVIHGDANGADRMAHSAALGLGLSVTKFPPLYDLYGRRAPHVRNDLMLDRASEVIAFWDGKSKGTKSVLDKAEKRGIPVEIIRTVRRLT